MTNIITPIISLDKSFILNDICVIAEKQNEAKIMKNTSAFLDFKVFLTERKIAINMMKPPKVRNFRGFIMLSAF